MKKSDFIDCDFCAKWHYPEFICIERERVYWKENRDMLKRKLSLAVKALEGIIYYAEALKPSPVHPVTFNACAIAQDALDKINE